MVNQTSRFLRDSHGWDELLPKRTVRQHFKTQHKTPWVVIGAGITGLSCSRRLAELHPSQSIILLEGSQVGQAASGRNSGFAMATSHFPGQPEVSQVETYRRINRINHAGLENLDQLVKEFDIDCQWQREGFIHTAAGSAAMREHDYFRQYLDLLNIAHDNLSQANLANLIGTDYYQAGIKIGDGALVQPAALVRGLADNLPTNLELYENSPVVELKSGKTQKVVLEQCEITADKVIVATNFEAQHLGFLRSRIVGSTLTGSLTRQLSDSEMSTLGALKEWGALSLHNGGATLRLTRDQRISIRNTAEYIGSRLLNDQELKQRQVLHRESFNRRFPQLAEVDFEFAWSCVEGLTRNGTNFFGRQKPGIYFAGGYNGSGISRGTAFGIAIADFASGKDSELVSDCLNTPKATWIPPRPILDIAAHFMVRSRYKDVGIDR
jgi:glycine/D-amino acid oxidase-like deaminating enzyme